MIAYYCDGCGGQIEPSNSPDYLLRIEYPTRREVVGSTGFVNAIFIGQPEWPPAGLYCGPLCLPPKEAAQ